MFGTLDWCGKRWNKEGWSGMDLNFIVWIEKIKIWNWMESDGGHSILFHHFQPFLFLGRNGRYEIKWVLFFFLFHCGFMILSVPSLHNRIWTKTSYTCYLYFSLFSLLLVLFIIFRKTMESTRNNKKYNKQ